MKNMFLTFIFLFGMGCCTSCGEDNDGAANNDSDTTNTGDSDSDTGSQESTDDNTGTDSDTSEARDPNADICNFTEDVSLGEADTDGMMLVPPNHPYINYFGRVDCSDPAAPALEFPGVSIRTSFTGTAIDMVFDDNGGTTTNYYNVIIDDGAPEVLTMINGEHTYELARDLAAGEHTIEIFKRIETNWGTGHGEFLGFRISAGEDLVEIAPRPYRIEFIGDSITCGYGVEISVDNPNDYNYTTTNSNSYNAWGSIAARALDAEVMLVAYSGRGAFRNYADGAGETMPQMYLRTLPNSSTAPEWDTNLFTPEILAINLGTNDFSTAYDAGTGALIEAYKGAMAEFVERLRGYYPDTAIILTVGPMLSSTQATYVGDTLNEIIDERATAGDTNVYFVEFPTQTSPYGEDWHPTIATQQSMADLLVEFINTNNLLAE